MNSPTPLERRLRISASLILSSLLVEALSLRWSHPTAFLVLLLLGGSLFLFGVLLYFYSLVWISEPPSRDKSAGV